MRKSRSIRTGCADWKKTEAENLQIVQLVRSMRLTPQELTAMLAGGGIPGIAPMPADYEEQEDNADEE